jgi:DNA repair exonuclease SbcCD ATPase subunit
MIRQIKLTNFRSVENEVINLTPGLNVLKGGNEHGKTTRIESILYALFGSKGLRESLAKVVTYDKPESSLKVELDFTIDGVDYKIVRGKSGAELTYPGGIVTGQTEVRIFAERLLGCSADIAKQLMIADQNAVRGVLSAGGAAAGNLVEKLAELDVIESLIERILTNLPSGNTKSLEAQIEQARSNIGDAPVAPSDAAVQAAQNRWNTALAHKESLQALWAVLAIKLSIAQATLARAAEVQKDRCKAQALAEKLTAEAVAPKPLAFTEADLAAARRLAADEAAMAARRKAYATKFPKSTLAWDDTFDSMLAAEKEAKDKLAECKVAQQQYRVQLATVRATRINEDVCAFCKKDISKLPEVAVINDKATARENELSASIVALKNDIGLLEGELQSYADLKDLTTKIKLLAGESWSLSADVPPVPTWIGAVPEPEGTVVDLQGMETQLRQHALKAAKAQAAGEQLAALHMPEEIDTLQASADAADCEIEKVKLEVAVKEDATLQQAHERAVASLAADMRVYNLQVGQREQAQKQVEASAVVLDDMYKHNGLVKKLRAARPEIATQLWNTVLGSIGHYFTAIRGTTSILTRTSEGFEVNGRSVEGLSGSTQDALGLAIRIALSKTFLPGIPLLVVDEPFSGCSEGRELAGLGMLAAAGFEQTILITHSSLADAFSTNLIEV